MAERRMFSKAIVDSDAFLDMPISTQCLYFHLSMRADDEGFVNNPKRIQRMIGTSDDDMRLLIAKQFIIPFESGICVIKHWFIHNYIRNDRFKGTNCVDEKSKLFLDGNKAYCLDDGMALGIPKVDQMETQDRIGKDSIGKSKRKRESTSVASLPSLEELEQRFSPNLAKAILDWFEYKQQRRDSYTPIGLKSLLTQIDNHVKRCSEQAVTELIYLCISNQWKGIIWDKIKKYQENNQSQTLIEEGWCYD